MLPFLLLLLAVVLVGGFLFLRNRAANVKKLRNSQTKSVSSSDSPLPVTSTPVSEPVSTPVSTLVQTTSIASSPTITPSLVTASPSTQVSVSSVAETSSPAPVIGTPLSSPVNRVKESVNKVKDSVSLVSSRVLTSENKDMIKNKAEAAKNEIKNKAEAAKSKLKSLFRRR